MAEQTGIEWTDHTFNPWWGCEKVSPGCAHCYAEGVSNRYEGPGLWGAEHRFRFFGDKHWAEPLKWNRKAEAEGVRRRVFCASMADVFEDRPELEEHRWRLFTLIAQTPELDWQILTKRPEFARDWLVNFYELYAGLALSREPGARVPLARGCTGLHNVWLGVSIENARHTWRADVLREIPAAVRFLSCEPLLGSLFPVVHDDDLRSLSPHRAPLDLTGIDWVIVGGESGRAARPMHPDWVREVERARWAHCQCRDAYAGVHEPTCAMPAFFFKQWGEWAPYEWQVGDRFDESRMHAFGSGSRNVWVERVGKKRAGRELDGRTWSEFPASAAVPA